MAEASRTASPATAQIVEQVLTAMKAVPIKDRESAYVSQMGVLLSTFRSKRDGVRVLNDLALHGFGLPEVPAISPKAAQSAGVDRIPEVKIASGSRGPRSRDFYDNEDAGDRSSYRRYGGGMGRRSYDRNDRNDRYDRYGGGGGGYGGRSRGGYGGGGDRYLR